MPHLLRVPVTSSSICLSEKPVIIHRQSRQLEESKEIQSNGKEGKGENYKERDCIRFFEALSAVYARYTKNG